MLWPGVLLLIDIFYLLTPPPENKHDNGKNNHLKTHLLLKTGIFRCHLSFRGVYDSLEQESHEVISVMSLLIGIFASGIPKH